MSRKNKVISLTLTLVMLLICLFQTAAYADTTSLRYFERGVLTDGTHTAYYAIDKDNRVLYLSGDGLYNGETPDYPSAAEGPFAGRTDVTRIVIEEDITRVGDYVFANMKSVDTLEIQANLVTDSQMSAKAMIGCTSLRNIQGDSALFSTNVLIQVVKGAVNIAGGNWLELVKNGINIVQTGVNGDGSLDDETVKTMVNDYIMTGEEVFLGDLDEAQEEYEERISCVCYYDNKYNHYFTSEVTAQPKCTEPGEKTYTCLDCGYTYTESVAPTGHSYTESVFLAPAEDREGIKKCVCSKCGDTKYEPIPPTGTNPDPGTDPGNDPDPGTDPIDDYKGFPDVEKGSWYYDAVKFCAQHKFVNGYGNGKFGPNDALQRQDFVVILANISKADLSKYTKCKLSDVDMNSYYGKAVAWGVDKGIISGYQNGKFGVGDPITREQVATILYNYMKKPYVSVTNLNSTLANFKDESSISSFARKPLAWAAMNNVITGMADGSAAPQGTAVRAQIASIIMRMDQNGMFNS